MKRWDEWCIKKEIGMVCEPPITDNETTTGEALGDSAAQPPLQINPDEYREDLADFDLTKEQQDELLQTLWNMMSMMVDLGWGLDSVQLFAPNKLDAESINQVEQPENIVNVSISNEKGPNQ